MAGTLFLDTDALNRLAAGGLLGTLINQPRQLVVTSTVVEELAEAAGDGFPSSVAAYQWVQDGIAANRIERENTPGILLGVIAHVPDAAGVTLEAAGRFRQG